MGGNVPADRDRPTGFKTSTDQEEEDPDDREADLRKFLQANGLAPDAVEQACNLARERRNGAADEPPDLPTGMRPTPGGKLTPKKGQDAALAWGFSPLSNAMERRDVESRKLAEALAAEGMVAMDSAHTPQARARVARGALSAHVNKTSNEFSKDCPFASKIGFV
jgi:hypothetical protein